MISDLLRHYETFHQSGGTLGTDHERVTLTGPDAESWLQGQLTQDVRKAGNHVLRSCLTDNKGRTLGILRIWRVEDRFEIIGDPVSIGHLKERIESSIILEEVESEVATGHHAFVWGEPDSSAVLRLESENFGRPCWEVWADAKVDGTVSSELQSLLEIESGEPKLGFEIDEKTFVPELGLNFEGEHISYNKGCYVGQEVLMRLHSRGHTNRTLVRLKSEAELLPGAALEPGGKVTRGVPHPQGGWIALGFLPNLLAESPSIWKDGRPVRVQEL